MHSTELCPQGLSDNIPPSHLPSLQLPAAVASLTLSCLTAAFPLLHHSYSGIVRLLQPNKVVAEQITHLEL